MSFLYSPQLDPLDGHTPPLLIVSFFQSIISAHLTSDMVRSAKSDVSISKCATLSARFHEWQVSEGSPNSRAVALALEL